MSKRSDSGLDGILLVDKAAGWTSHDVVARARRVTGQRRIGHTGTLDPMATGLLVLCLGRATRLVEYLTGHDKRYTGTVFLGRGTTTDDAEGETVSEAPVPALTESGIETVLASFRGPILQRPPAFSALKVGGERSYRLARKGNPLELPPRPVSIHGLTARIPGPNTLEIDVTCSAGTYIRSLARDIGSALACGGHLSALRRQSAGPFSLEDAVPLETLERAANVGRLNELLLPADDGIAQMDVALLGPDGVDAIANGRSWQAASYDGEGANPLRIYSGGGEFVAVGSVSNLGEIRAAKVFLRANSAK